MAAEVATLSGDAVARVLSRLHLPTWMKGAGIRRMATVRDAAFIGWLNALLPSYAAEMREAWGRLQAATAGHLSDADARVMEREVEAASGSQKELTAFLDNANNFRLRNEIILPSTEHNPVTVDLYGDALMNLPHAVPLGNTVPMDDELKDTVPDAELSLPAFNVVTGSYDPRSLKFTLLEFKTVRYGVKYTAVPRATDVDRFERSLLGDIQRGLAARDAEWHNTEPGHKGPHRDILDMSEYTGMVLGTVGGAWVG
eukprot:jgi/Tetstr1/455770/TSEL_042567.t1